MSSSGAALLFASHLCPLQFPFSVAESANTHLQDELMGFTKQHTREIALNVIKLRRKQ
uniref:Uncharacterized protein n=2 Tax=Brassica oleracea TaxID=3712 RepID=A0A0D3CGZ5_BRAOL